MCAPGFFLSVRRLAALRRHGSAFVPCVLALVLGVGVLASLLHFLTPRLNRGVEETSGLFVCVPRAAALCASSVRCFVCASCLCSVGESWALDLCASSVSHLADDLADSAAAAAAAGSLHVPDLVDLVVAVWFCDC